METLELDDELVARIRNLAAKQQRSVEDLMTDMLQRYYPIPNTPVNDDNTPENDPLVGLIGLLDDEIQETDLSSMNG